ncbi:Oligosaccharide translocation protein rft1 [Lobulomyces angularis]|nr:Oligosaccharide translocation protein rft1 [Lobulomyces angularis]
MRISKPETIALITITLEVIYSTILFLSRENIRMALLRSSKFNAALLFKKKSKELENKISDVEEDKKRKLELNNFKKIINFSWIPLCIGMFITGTVYVLQGYFINFKEFEKEEYSEFKFLNFSVVLYLISSLLELLTEPMFNVLQQDLKFNIRAKIEGLSFVIKCLLSVGLSLLNLNENGLVNVSDGVLVFSKAQLSFSISLCLFYFIYFGFFYFENFKLTYFLPSLILEEGKSYFFDANLLTLSETFIKQSVLKHLLTEGDKFLLLKLNVISDQKGAYGFVYNLGSLVARIIFNPLEETMRLYFSKTLTCVTNVTKNDINFTKDLLKTLLHFQLLFGSFFIFFGINYSTVLVLILGGNHWVATDAPKILKYFCLYVPVMGLNGITEAFLQGVGDENALHSQNNFLIFNAIFFVFNTLMFVNVLNLGTVGFVLGNIFNLIFRTGFSLNFIKKFFFTYEMKFLNEEEKFNKSLTDSQPKVEKFRLRDCMPDSRIYFGFLVSGLFTYLGEDIFGIASAKQILFHIGFGLLFFIFMAGLM